MTQRTLHQYLTDLHAELLAVQSDDPATQGRLKPVADDIGAIIDRGPKDRAPEEFQALRGRLAEAAAAFESSHPQLTTTLENLIDTLALHTL